MPKNNPNPISLELAAKKKLRNKMKRLKKKEKKLGITGSGAYSISDIGSAIARGVEKAKEIANYEPTTNVGKGTALAATTLAKAFDLPGARTIGNAAAYFTKLLGFGDYEVCANSLMARTPYNSSGLTTNSVPYMGSCRVGSDIIFAHREFCFDVTSSINLAVTELPINPGNPLLFPFLSRIASNYEEFQFLGLVFEYKTTSAVAVGTTSSAMGAVVMATDYDCYDTTYVTKRAMEAAEFSCSGAPYDTFLHPVECDPKRNNSGTFFVVPGITQYTQAPGDARNSVLGNFALGRVGQQADATNIGELWVTYHVRLSRPILESESGATDFSQHIWGFTTGVADPVPTITGNVSSSERFDVAFTGTSAVTKRMFITANTSSLVAGQYLVVITSHTGNTETFTTAIPATPYCAAIGNATTPNHMWNISGTNPNGQSIIDGHCSSTTSGYSVMPGGTYFTIVNITGLGGGLSVPVPCSASENSFFDVYICAWNGTIVKPSTVLERIERLEKMQSRSVDIEECHKFHTFSSSSSSSSSSNNSQTYPLLKKGSFGKYVAIVEE